MKTLFILTTCISTRVGDAVLQQEYQVESEAITDLDSLDNVEGSHLARIVLDDEDTVIDIKTKTLHAQGLRMDTGWEPVDFADLDIFALQVSRPDAIYWVMKGQYLHPGVDQRQSITQYDSTVWPWWKRNTSIHSSHHKTWWRAYFTALLIATFEGGGSIEIRSVEVREKMA